MKNNLLTKVTLGSFAKSQTGPFGSQLHKEDYVITGVPIVTVEHLGDIGFTHQNLPCVSNKDVVRLSKYRLNKGDIVFSRVGSIDRSVYVEEEENGWLFSGRCLRVRCNKQVNSKYLSYYFKQRFFKDMMLNLSVGATMPSLNTSIMDNLEIFLLPKEQQNNIAELLGVLDKKIILNNKTNDELEKMVKTLYDYWFVQFDFPDENGKPYKSSGGKMVYNNKLKVKIPNNWNADEIKNKISFDRGISYTSKDIESSEGLPMINLASINTKRGYRPNELKFYSGKYNDNKLVIKNDMLIACTDLTRNADIIGSPILVPAECEKYLYSMDLAKLNILSSKLKKMYLYMTLRTDFYHNFIKWYASGTNVLHLDLAGIKYYPIVIPTDEIQEKFEQAILPLIEMQHKILNETQKLVELRDWLLPMLMNGQVTIKDSTIIENNALSEENIIRKSREFWQKKGRLIPNDFIREIGIVIYKKLDCNKAEATFNHKTGLFEIGVKDPQDNFSIFHELGHIVKHSDKLRTGTFGRKAENSGDKKMEAEADEFSAEILMPEDFVNEYLIMQGITSNKDWIDEKIISNCAKHFDVNPPAMSLRLKNLGYKVPYKQMALTHSS